MGIFEVLEIACTPAGIGCLAASAYSDRINRLVLIEGLGAVTGDLTNASYALRRSIESRKQLPQTKRRGSLRAPSTLSGQRLASCVAHPGSSRSDGSEHGLSSIPER